MKRVGFIGVGSIGAPMARCVIRAGFKVTVCDNNPKALQQFAASDIEFADTPADCASQDMVIVIVANDQQVKEVVLGDTGLLSAVDPRKPPRLAIMSTVMPETVHAVADLCARKAVRVIDAPVSGLPVVAEQGKLTIMVGGTTNDLEDMRPVLRSMGENIFHTGSLGTGEVTKLVNNVVGLTNLFLTVEAMLIAKHHGMDLLRIAAIMETSSGRNFSTQDWDRAKATFAYFARSLDLSKVAVDVSSKDLRHAQELARQAHVACPLLDRIADAVSGLSYQEVQANWAAIA